MPGAVGVAPELGDVGRDAVELGEVGDTVSHQPALGRARPFPALDRHVADRRIEIVLFGHQVVQEFTHGTPLHSPEDSGLSRPAESARLGAVRAS